MITDKLRSYGAARAKIDLRVEHRQQRFLSVHDQVANLFHIPYPEFATADFRRASRERAFAVWREISRTGATA
jgi:putative transposase